MMSKKLKCKKPHAANDECHVHMPSKKMKRSKKRHVGNVDDEVGMPSEKLQTKKPQVASVEHEVDMPPEKVKRSKKRHVGNVEDEVDMPAKKLESKKSQVANVEGEVDMPLKKVKHSKKHHVGNVEDEVDMPAKKMESKKSQVASVEDEVDMPAKKLKSKKSQVANVEDEVDMPSKKMNSKKRHVGNVDDEVGMPSEKLQSKKPQVASVEDEVDMESMRPHVISDEHQVDMPSKKMKTKKPHVASDEGQVDMASKKLKCKKRDTGNVEDEDIPLKSMNLPSKRPHDEDRLTSLHDSLVAHILSYLCTRDAIRTSTLCREWKYKWTLSYNFNMSDFYKEISTRTFVNVMDRIFISAGLKLRNFHLVCRSYNNYSSRLQLWISTALAHDLESFIFSVCYIPTEARIVFPRSLINGTSLQILKLEFSSHNSKIILNVAMHNFVPRLTSLILKHLEIELNGGDSSSSIVTFKFDVLKELELNEIKWVNVKSVEIYAPCLTRLKSVEYDRQTPDYSIVVNAPMLTMFEIGGFMRPDNIRILNGSSVTCARITGISHKHVDPQLGIKVGLQIRNRLRAFTSLEILELWDSFAYVTASAETALYRFDHLRELTVMLWHRVGDLVGDLFQLLDAAPTLKFLKVNLATLKRFDDEEVEHVPACIAYHLEEVELCTFSGGRPHYNLAKFFMLNGGKLRKIHVALITHCKDHVRRKLSKFPRISPLTISVS